MRLRKREPGSENFRLDRDRFCRHLRHEFGEPVGIELALESGGIAAAIESRFLDARDAGAILGPPGLGVIVYGLDDSLIVAVREEELPSIPTPLRQLATHSFEVKYVLDRDDRGFAGICAVIEELLERASSLLPSFEALRSGERALLRAPAPRCISASGLWRHCRPARAGH